MDTTRNNNGNQTDALMTRAGQWQSGDRPGLSAVIERIRQRWRLRLCIDGLLWTLVIATGLMLISAWLLNVWHFSATALWLLRLINLLALLALVLHFCIKPMRRRVDDLQVALYLEEHEKDLNSILSSAVDARRAESGVLSPPLVGRLVERAIDACAQIDYGDSVERSKLQLGGSKLGLVLLVIIGLALWPPGFLRTGAPALLQAWASASEVSPYQIELAPGDIDVERGDDQLISADIPGFNGAEVLLFTSIDAGISWRETTMASVDGNGRYQAFVFDLDQDTDYYVTGAGKRTSTHRLGVVDIPALESIGLRYHFPAYTMLPPVTSEGSGDISALRGTRVEVLIKPTIDIPGGTLQLADGRQIELQATDDATWVGEIRVQQDGAYQVALQRTGGIPVKVSGEFRIDALDDRLPSVAITSPGRDTKVSSIEEPILKIRASDDQGIARLELVLSVNGETEQRIDLTPASRAPGASQQVDALHTVYLEDLGLQPGDLISYYVHARDLAPSDVSNATARTATSDIFFYQVRPFRNNYRRAEQQGGGGGGGAQGGQQQGQLSEQQRQFVVATFKMIRDRNSYSDEAYQDNLELLTTAQARIRDRVEAIVRRIGSRPIAQADETTTEIMQALPLAVEAMLVVEQQLQSAEIEAALTDAQIALKYLQRADAAFRDFNISQRNRAGGGAGSNTGTEDLANLFQLEMDKLRHQYETVQHSAQQPPPSEVIDDTLDKLRELARRQQQEVERAMRRRDQAQSNASNEDQLALAEELEAMARQLEKLSRKQPNPQLRQSVEQMRKAAESMRRAAAGATGGGQANGAANGSASGGGGGGAVADARQAAQDLSEARRLLDQGRVRQFSEKVEQSLRRAELAERKQADIKQDLSKLDEKRGPRLEDQLRQLDQKKQELTQALTNLESDLSSLTTSASEEQPEANRSLKQAIRAGREHRLHDRIGRSSQMVLLDERKHALDNETKIQQGIGEIRQHIETALANVGATGNRGLERSLDELRGLARELRYQREQASGGATGIGSGGATTGRIDNRDDPIRQQQLNDIAERTRKLGSGLLDQGVPAGDLDAVLTQIETLSQSQKNAAIPASTADYDSALRALMELEYQLRNQLDAPEYPELLIADPTDLPDEYRDMVAEYFRKLSEQ